MGKGVAVLFGKGPARERKETETKRELPKACQESKGDGKKDELDAKG